MMANAQMKKPSIPLSKLTENRIGMYTKRLNALKEIQERESKDQGKAWVDRKKRNQPVSFDRQKEERIERKQEANFQRRLLKS